jgi:hypothetical protein
MPSTSPTLNWKPPPAPVARGLTRQAACPSPAARTRTVRMENPGVRGPIESTAKRVAALAEKLERARRNRSA